MKTNKSQISTKYLAMLRKKLPHGSIKSIADTLSIDASIVSRVLKGERHNTKIIEMAVEIIENQKIQDKILEERISNL